jgi:hypothetical protein
MQVSVTGGGSGKVDAEMVKFPGAYKETDDYANFSIYNGAKDFPMPGPKVWSGATSAGGSSPAGGNDAPAETPAAGNEAPVQNTPAPDAGNGQQQGGEQQQGNQGGFPAQGNQGGFPGAQNTGNSPCSA